MQLLIETVRVGCGFRCVLLVIGRLGRILLLPSRVESEHSEHSESLDIIVATLDQSSFLFLLATIQEATSDLPAVDYTSPCRTMSDRHI